MACTLIPISFDDNGKPLEMTLSHAQCICMPVPWLFFTGFTVTFSALFSKTWRVNKFFHSKSAFSRITVSEYEVIAPFIILLSLNTIVLVTWTIIDPLKYTRTFDLATDYWNREMRSTGMCESQNTVYFLVPLVISKWREERELIDSEWIHMIDNFCRSENLSSYLTYLPLFSNNSKRYFITYCCMAILASPKHKIRVFWSKVYWSCCIFYVSSLINWIAHRCDVV